jgi:hypothetical protein
MTSILKRAIIKEVPVYAAESLIPLVHLSVYNGAYRDFSLFERYDFTISCDIGEFVGNLTYFETGNASLRITNQRLLQQIEDQSKTKPVKNEQREITGYGLRLQGSLDLEPTNFGKVTENKPKGNFVNLAQDTNIGTLKNSNALTYQYYFLGFTLILLLVVGVILMVNRK